MKIVNRAAVAGGYTVTIEYPAAFTDGTSRFEEVFVADGAVSGKSSEQVRQAVKDAVDDDPLGTLLGTTVAAPAQTKLVREEKMVAQYDRWQRWQQTRIEAQSRGLAANIITALTNQEDAAWTTYATAIQAWRAAS